MGRPHITIAQGEIDFIAPSPPRLATRRPCVVCQLRTDMLLCRECADQPEASKARVLAWLNGNTDQANVLLDAWDAVRQPQQAAWERIQDSLDLPDYADRCARHRAAGNVYGKLLQALDDYEDALKPLDSERRRLEKALEALERLC